MLLELLFVVTLIVVNGLLAMSELAIVSSRPAQLKVRAERGDSGARTALRLSDDSGRFLSTVQIGITLVSVLSGAISGATLGARLATVLPGLGVPVGIADEIGVGMVVIAITYLSLIVGELVPKQIALANPEAVASRVAPAMQFLSRVTSPLVWILNGSGKLVLTLLGQSGKRETTVSDAEIRMIIADAEGTGVIEKGETEMITGVMRIADRSASGLMTPRHEVDIAKSGETLAELRARFQATGRTRLPLQNGRQDELLGVVHSRDLLHAVEEGFDPIAIARPAPIVNDALPAMQVVERLKGAPEHMLFVYDEYGQFEGIITAMDILGGIAGSFDETVVDKPKIVEREDGSFLVAGWMPIDEFVDRIGIDLQEDPSYETVAGLVLHQLAEFPQVGQYITVGNWEIEVVDMDGRRIDKLLVQHRIMKAAV